MPEPTLEQIETRYQKLYWFVHGTLGYPILEGIDYLNELDEDSSCMEQAFSIFMNNIELDNEGNI